MHRRFPKAFTPAVITLFATALAPPHRATVSAVEIASAELKEKEDAARVARQRPVLRVCAELALVGIIRDGQGKSGGEWIMKTLKDLVSRLSSHSTFPLLHIYEYDDSALWRSFTFFDPAPLNISQVLCATFPWNNAADGN